MWKRDAGQKKKNFRNILLGMAGTCAAGLAVLFLESHRELNKFRVNNYRLTLPGGPKGRILFVTDYHEAVGGKMNPALLRAAREQKPDLILIGGDMVNGKKEDEDYRPAVDLINGLVDIAPIYYSYGNHERRMITWSVEGNYHWEDYRKALDPRVHFLVNEDILVPLPGGNVRLYGYEMERRFFIRHGEALTKAAMVQTLGEVKKDAPVILLAHDPTWGPVYGEWGADLTLSGHYHGGVIRLPLLGGFVSPKFKIFPHFDRGYYEEGTTRMLVGTGLGQHTIPVRFCNLPELVVIDLV